MIKTYSTFLQKKKKIQETQRTTESNVKFIMLELFTISSTMLKENHIEYIDLEYNDSLYLYKNKIKSICYSPFSDSFIFFLSSRKIAEFLQLEFTAIMQDVKECNKSIFLNNNIIIEKIDNDNYTLEIIYADEKIIKETTIKKMVSIK
jgi:hypothetical protein